MKLTNFYFFLVVLFLISCSSETVEEQIQNAEAAFVTSPNPETGQPLMDLLLANVPTDTATAMAYLSQASDIYQKIADQMTTGAKKEYLLKMKPHATMMEAGMTPLSKTMYNEEQHQLDGEKAGAYISTCEVFAKIQPDNPQSPALLFKAAETARAMRNFGKAIELYDNIYDNYQDYEKHAQTLFLKAFTLDNDLKRHDEAKGLYELFLKKYPENDFADDTEFLLANLGKSDEEIIQKFEEEE